MLIISMFVFELTYRARVSPVTLVHHVCACILAAWQIASAVNGVGLDQEIPRVLVDRSSDSQFVLISASNRRRLMTPAVIYGCFEVCFEVVMHLACIAHKKYSKSRPEINWRIWAGAGIWVFIGSISEMICVAVYMRYNWYLWTLSLKILMPVLHFAFMAAQLHGARIAYTLTRKYRRLATEARSAATGDIEAPMQEKIDSAPILPIALRQPSEVSVVKSD